MGNTAAVLLLTLVSLAAGLGALWMFGRLSHQEAIRNARRKLRAHLYELSLFAHDPVLIWRAQKHLLVWNLRYLRLALKPAVILTIPMALLLIQLDTIYGRRPLRPGESAIITAHLAPAVDLNSASLSLEAPAGAAVETPAVRLAEEHEVCWRVRVQRDLAGVLHVRAAGRAYDKRLVAAGGLAYVSARRVNSRLKQLWYAGESVLPGDTVEWIEVDYPQAEIRVFGWKMHWPFWFFIVSMAGALMSRKRLGVTF
jgi:hypothetical protein